MRFSSILCSHYTHVSVPQKKLPSLVVAESQIMSEYLPMYVIVIFIHCFYLTFNFFTFVFHQLKILICSVFKINRIMENINFSFIFISMPQYLTFFSIFTELCNLIFLVTIDLSASQFYDIISKTITNGTYPNVLTVNFKFYPFVLIVIV